MLIERVVAPISCLFRLTQPITPQVVEMIGALIIQECKPSHNYMKRLQKYGKEKYIAEQSLHTSRTK